MNKHEVEIQKLNSSAQKFDSAMRTIARIRNGLTAYASISRIVSGLQEIVPAKADAIHELSLVVEKFNITGISGSIVGVMGVTYGAYERHGKKKQLEKNDELRRELRKNEPKRSSSGLDKHGHTPRR